MAVKNKSASVLARLRNQAKEAVSETTKHRGRELEEDVFGRIEKFDESEFFRIQWSKFEPAVEINLPFSDTLKRLSDFLEPIYAAILRGEEFQGQWKCEQKNKKIAGNSPLFGGPGSCDQPNQHLPPVIVFIY